MAQKENIKESVLFFYNAIRGKFPVKGILLYGSHAKGTARRGSDIDVGVIIDSKNHNERIKITADLFHEASKTDVRIEPKCIFWDEYLHYDKAGILAEIIKTGIRIV